MIKPLTMLLLILFNGFFAGDRMHAGHNTSLPSGSAWKVYRSFAPAISGHSLNFHAAELAEAVVLPLKRAGNLILLEAIVDGNQGNLILDTGSSDMVLNSMYFREGGRTASVVSGGITGAAAVASRIRINELQLSGMAFSRLEAGMMDLGHIESARNIKILGFFGLSLFADYEVVVDLYHGVLELHRLNMRGYRSAGQEKAPKFDLSLPVTVVSNVVFVDAAINNSKLTFCLDTGAESNVLGSGLPGRVLSAVDIHSRSTLKGAGTRNVEVLYGTLNNFSIGRKDIQGMGVIITNMNTMSHFYGTQVHGMLGCEFLEKGTFYINMKQQRVSIIFNGKEEK